jgi:sterol desaturase/sphingolipid hydroxylase (fatty acid hydroxylase superfamily)
METLSAGFTGAQQALFESVVQPLLYALGGASLLEDAYVATGWWLVGMLQLVLMLAVIAPLQRWRPVEALTDRAAVRVDILYTLLQRLGVLRVLMFFAVDPLWNALFGWLSLQGLSGWQLDAWLAPWWPGVTDGAVFAFVVYLLVFDLADYGIHRGQHGIPAWWALHALHHSQRQMTMWSDSRNHLLDGLIRDSLLVLLARAIGMPPAQFVAVVALTQLLESLSHANLRLGFGLLGERLLVSPRFHRMHHGIGRGHESGGAGTLGGHNFAVLFPVWDLVFGTADFKDRFEPTGVRDQLPAPAGRARDYGCGFWAQQWRGLQRMVGRA